MLALSTDSISHILVLAIQLFSAWSLVFLLVWSVFKTGSQGINHLKKLHEVPCSGCAFFTNDYRLKCTVHPCKALSEEAIGCRDFEPGYTYNLKIHPQCDSGKSCFK